MKPFGNWTKKTKHIDKLVQSVDEEFRDIESENLRKRMTSFAWSMEDIELILHPMITEKKEDLLILQIKANMSIIGPKFGKNANEVKSLIEQSDPENILSKLNIEDSCEIQGNLISKEDIEIVSSDQVGFSVSGDAGHFVGIDINLTDELRLEGLARELIHAIQNIRKNSGFEISQNIKIEYIAGEKFDSVIESFGDLISKETLAKMILKVQEIQLSVIEELRLNGEDVVIGLTTLD